MDNWRLFRWLCRIVVAADRAALEEVLAAGSLPQLVTMAGSRQLLPALAARIEEHPALACGIPASLRAPLEAGLRDNTQRQLHLRTQAIKVARSLNAIGIEPVYLKGTALMWLNRGAPAGFRAQTDIDLLLAPAELDAAVRALVSDGYQFCDYSRPGAPQLFSDYARARHLGARHHHLPAMLKPGQPATLEIHSHPLPRRYQRTLPLAELLGTPQGLQAHGASFRLLPLLSQQLLVVLGVFAHDGYYARCDFPLKAAHDYLSLAQLGGAAGACAAVAAGGKYGAVFEQLLCELTAFPPALRNYEPRNIDRRLAVMRYCHRRAHWQRALDAQARMRYLAGRLADSPGKLPAYLQRKLAH